MIDNIERLVAADVPGLDIIHGEMKSWMLENEELIEEAANNELLLEYLKGYGDALAEVYNLTYSIYFAQNDLTNTA